MMEYGKVKISRDWRKDYIVTVGVGIGGQTLQKSIQRKDYAYSEARHIRNMVKRGTHPMVVTSQLGGYLTA